MGARGRVLNAGECDCGIRRRRHCGRGQGNVDENLSSSGRATRVVSWFEPRQPSIARRRWFSAAERGLQNWLQIWECGWWSPGKSGDGCGRGSRISLKTWGSFRCGRCDHLDGTLHYGAPLMEDVPGFKIGHHGPGRETDPDRVAREVQAGDEASFRPVLGDMIPAADGALLSMKVCMYTNSPDHHFIIDRHPGDERVTLACGFSGHGFKFASVVGEILAGLGGRGKTGLPAQFLGLKRSRCNT